MKLNKNLTLVALMVTSLFFIHATTANQYSGVIDDLKAMEKSANNAAVDYKHIAIFSVKNNKAAATQLSNRLNSVETEMEDLSATCAKLAKRKMPSAELEKKRRLLMVGNEARQKANYRLMQQAIKDGASGTTIAKSATALRKGMQDLKNLAQDIRAEVMAMKNSSN